MENPPVMTYGILKKIVSCIKEEGKKAFPDTEIRVGETFDIGPEFAISDFKYTVPPVADSVSVGKYIICRLHIFSPFLWAVALSLILLYH